MFTLCLKHVSFVFFGQNSLVVFPTFNVKTSKFLYRMIKNLVNLKHHRLIERQKYIDCKKKFDNIMAKMLDIDSEESDTEVILSPSDDVESAADVEAGLDDDEELDDLPKVDFESNSGVRKIVYLFNV